MTLLKNVPPLQPAREWSWEKLLAEGNGLLDGVWAYLVAHPLLAGDVPIECKAAVLLLGMQASFTSNKMNMTALSQVANP